MRSKRLDLSEILKVGLSPKDGVHTGLSMLKNLRTNGQALVGCPTLTTTKKASCEPFTLRSQSYYINSTGLFSTLSGTPLLVYTWVGTPKIVNMIDVVWLQDDVKTYIVDNYGISLVNPSGNQIPLCNDIALMNGQILCAGFLDGFNTLDDSFIGYSEISFDRFTLSKDNTAGFYNPNIGSCLNILPMQDNAIVLGSRGACQMFYAGHIFGFRDLDVPLLKAKHLCASSTNIVIYIAEDGNIVKIDKNGTSAYLGYRWIGKNTLTVRYLNGRNQFVFTTADNSYILDDKGMFSYGYKVWGEFNNSVAVDTDFVQDSWEFGTFETDFGKAGIKIANEVFIQDSLRGLAQRFVKIESSGTVNSQGWKPLNLVSASKYPIGGDTFSLSYKTDTEPAITEAIVEIQDLDKRFGNGYTPYSGGTK